MIIPLGWWLQNLTAQNFWNMQSRDKERVLRIVFRIHGDSLKQWIQDERHQHQRVYSQQRLAMRLYMLHAKAGQELTAAITWNRTIAYFEREIWEEDMARRERNHAWRKARRKSWRDWTYYQWWLAAGRPWQWRFSCLTMKMLADDLHWFHTRRD